MTSKKAKRTSLFPGRGIAGKDKERHAPEIGHFDRLESRELLSTLQPVTVSVQWMSRGSRPLHELRFDSAGNCLSGDCSLDQFGSAPNRITVQFNGPMDVKSFSLASDVSITGDVSPSNPLHPIRGTAKKSQLIISTTGNLADLENPHLNLDIHGIRGKGKAVGTLTMNPWSVQLGGTSDGSGGGPIDTTPPTVFSVSPQPGSTLGQAPRFIDVLFSEDVDSASATSSSNFQVVGSGGDGVFGNGNDASVPLTGLSYNSATHGTHLDLPANLPDDTYRLQVNSGVHDLAGNALETYRANFTVATPVQPPTFSPGDPVPPVVTGVSPSLDAVVSQAPFEVSVTFNEPIDPASATPDTVRLVASGRDGVFGNGNDRTIAVSSVQTRNFGREVALSIAETLDDDVYRIQLGSSGPTDLAANIVDGDRDGVAGGQFASEFRIDRSTPEFSIELAPSSSTGVRHDMLTNSSSNLGLFGQVNDGSLARLGGYQVDLDVDGDGFDDGQAVTDASGAFTVTSNTQVTTNGAQNVAVRVTDRAGNSSIQSVAVNVDSTAPIFLTIPIDPANPPDSGDYRFTAAGHLVRVYDTSPRELRIKVSEPLIAVRVADLKNYTLDRPGRNGLFASTDSTEVSNLIQSAEFNDATREIVITLAPNLPAGEYRLTVAQDGSITDLAGNRPLAPAVLGFNVGAFNPPRAFVPTVVPMLPGNTSDAPVISRTPIETSGGTEYLTGLSTRHLDPLLRITVTEQEPPGGSTNDPFDTANPGGNPEPLVQAGFPVTPFGVDAGEDPDVTIFGTADSATDVDFYSFRAKAGESVRFSVTDQFGFFAFADVAIWDLGTDNAIGGTGDAADRQLISNVHKLIDPTLSFFTLQDLPSIEVMITGITGNAMDNPQDEVLNPPGTEDRAPQDRTYLLSVASIPGPYVVSGEMWQSYTRRTKTPQIIYVDFNGNSNIPFPNLVSGGTQLITMPPFDVRDFDLDPIFQSTFIEQTMAEVREDIERVRAQSINPNFTVELRDSLHDPDPGNAPNVLRVNVGGVSDLTGLPGLGLLGIADSVDTGNRVGNNNVLVFSKSIAQLAQFGVFPLGLGPDQVHNLALEIAETISHEARHTLGLWHTNMNTFTLDPTGTFFQCTIEANNLIDFAALTIAQGDDTQDRIDRFVNLDDAFCSGRLEFFDGVADSVGTVAWGLEGTDRTGPRVLDLKVQPGQIPIRFTEGVDPATLMNSDSITLLVDQGNNNFQPGTTRSVPLLPVGLLPGGQNLVDPCAAPVPAGVSFYNECTATLTVNLIDPVNDVPLDKKYRLVLKGVRDFAGNLIDGDINRTPQGDIVWPSGNGVLAANEQFQFDFFVSNSIHVDGDSVGQNIGTAADPITTVQQALRVAKYAGLKGALPGEHVVPVTVTVSPAMTPYLALDPLRDPTPGTQTDQGNLIVPDGVHLVFDGSSDVNEVLFAATPNPSQPNTLPGVIYRLDANSAANSTARVLGSFAAPLPISSSTGLAFNGHDLFLVNDAPGTDNIADSIYVLDPLTGAVKGLFSVPATTQAGRNVNGLAANGSLLYLGDSDANRILSMDIDRGVIVGNVATSFDLVGGIDYDADTNTLWAVAATAGTPDRLVQLNPSTGAVINTVPLPAGVTDPSGVGVADGEVFVSDAGSDQIIHINLTDPTQSIAFASPAADPSALAGVPVNQIVVQLLGTRIDVAGDEAALRAVGASLDRPVIFTSLRDLTWQGGLNTALPGDWMGIAFRPGSADVDTTVSPPQYFSNLENVSVHYAGGAGTVIPAIDPASQDPLLRFPVVQTLSPVSLFDARIGMKNVELAHNTEAAVAATVDSFERLLGVNGPDLYWDVDSGIPIPGDWDPNTPGDELGVFQSSTGKVFVDLNGNRKLDDSERPLTPFGSSDNDVLVVGNFAGGIPGDEIATFNRDNGFWVIDLAHSFDQLTATTTFFGIHGDVPIVGDWNGDGVDEIGVYRPHPRPTDDDLVCRQAAEQEQGCFILDVNGDLQSDSTEVFQFGDRDGVPVVGDFAASVPGTEIGVYLPKSGQFLLDRNGDRIFTKAEVDENGNNQEDPSEVVGIPNGTLDKNDGPFTFGSIGAKPVIGDWAPAVPGDEVGTVDGSSRWLIDANGNIKQDTTETLRQFGKTGDVPTPGDWAANAAGTELGVFRSVDGLWFLDTNHNLTLELSEDLDQDGHLDVNEDTNGNNILDPGEDLDGDGHLDVREDVDPDGGGPLHPNGVLDLNDGGFAFTAALRDDISDFVFDNSLNAVWVRPGFQTVSDAVWDDVQLPHVLTATVEVQALASIGVVPTLELHPGLVVKMGLANLSVGGEGATLVVDSDLELNEPRVVFTSLLDDARGPGGRAHDTNNDHGSIQPLPGDWGGIVLSSGSSAIINGADIEYAGNLRVPVGTALITPNPITLNQSACNLLFDFNSFVATLDCPAIFATITNNIIANTNSVLNTSPRTRPSDVAAIGVIGASLLGNGPNLPRIPFNANPFIRGNDVDTNNGLNGMEIRTSEFQDPVTDPLTFANAFVVGDTRWDDTDITHILLGSLQWVSDAFTTPEPFDTRDINSPNFLTGFNLTLASNPAGTYDEFEGEKDTPAESLVVKMGGRYSNRWSTAAAFPGTVLFNGDVLGGPINIGAGFNVGFDDGNVNTPCQNCIFDYGGDSSITVDGIIGDPERGIANTPVILTSIRDDTAGPKGVLEDTNNDGSATVPARGDWEGIRVGAWARNYGRVSPLNGAGLSASSVRNSEIRFANTAVQVQSQSVEISGNLIRNSNLAVDSLQGPNVPNMPAGTNPVPIPRDPASPVIYNNVLVQNGIAYRQTGGPDNANNILAESWPSRALFINNTVDANDSGLVIAQRSGPLIMNNSITNTTGVGLNVDNSSLRLNISPPEVGLLHDPIQIIRNLFFGNGSNGTTGTVPATVGGQEIVGIAPGYFGPGSPDFNYRPSQGSPLVDSALSEFGNAIGVFGTVQAPDRDKNGVFRRDNFGTPNVGVGRRPWLDIGAVELVDVASQFPRIVSVTPSPGTNFPNGFGPSSVELVFSEPVTNVGQATFIVEASGGDRSFAEGNEVRLNGSITSVGSSGGTRWVFTPAPASNFNNFTNEVFRVTVIGTGSAPVVSVASGNTLDGEFTGSLPSGDGVEGGDFRITFSIGDVIGRALYVDDTSPPCAGVPRTDPNLQLFNNIPAALAAAQPGDFILVCPGVYTAPITITVPVTLESLEGALPRKDALGAIIPGTGTFITVPGIVPAITINNVTGTTNPRIGSTRGGVNHGFVITTSPISGPVTNQASGVGINVVGSSVDIEGNVIISNSIGILADSGGTSRLPNIVNNLIVGNTQIGLGSGAGIDITSRTKDALATIINNTVSYNQSGILLREDGLDPQGRVVATVQNNIISSNGLTGLSTVSALANPNVFHNDAWGNANQTSNFGGRLPNITPSAGGPASLPCTPTLTVCGNISENPFFVNPVDPRSVSDRSDFFRLANFELQATSKLIDRGRDAGSPSRDFKGRTRTIDVPGVGNETSAPLPPLPDTTPRSVDIGAYEFVPGAVSSSVRERSTAGTSAAMDDVLDQLAGQAAEEQTNRKLPKRLRMLLDDWLDQLSE